MLDCFATERHYVDHLAPVWGALPDELRGSITVPAHLDAYARGRGIDPVGELDDVDRPTLVAGYTDQRRVRHLGRSRMAFLEHGIGQSYAGTPRMTADRYYAGGGDRDDVGLFLVPNEYAAKRWQAAYPDATVEIVGSPKVESLPAREPGPGPVIAVSWHWECQLSPFTRSAFGQFQSALPALVERFGAARILGHGHPRFIDRITKHYAGLGIEVVRDFEDVCRRADVYVCDNSSTLYEFAATGRPVVVLNRSDWDRSIDHGLRFWSAAGVGVNIDRPADLVAGVEAALEDRPEERAAREDALAIVYGHRSGSAALAAEAIARWAA